MPGRKPCREKNTGWGRLDPANCICTTRAHVRVGGPVWITSAPRGARHALNGGSGETMKVAVCRAGAPAVAELGGAMNCRNMGPLAIKRTE